MDPFYPISEVRNEGKTRRRFVKFLGHLFLTSFQARQRDGRRRQHVLQHLSRQCQHQRQQLSPHLCQHATKHETIDWGFKSSLVVLQLRN